MLSTAYPLVPALTVAVSYHTDFLFRFSFMLDDRASSEKNIGASSMGREDIVLSPQRNDHDETRLSTSSKAYFINSSTADGRNPRPESLVIAAHGRDEDFWHVTSKHKHLLSTSHGIARCFRTREASIRTRRCECTDQPQPLCDKHVYSRHQSQLHVLLPT